MAQSEYKVTEMFEEAVARYTNAPYAIAVDNCSNALFLSLYYENVKDMNITIPSHTYMSVPCAIIHTGGYVRFEDDHAKGAYQLKPTRVYDSALRFTSDMYLSDSLMCLSFTGPYKTLKLGKGGMVLTDDYDAYEWMKKARINGRNEINYNKDDFTMLGWNFYMMPELAVRGIQLMRSFYDSDGRKLHNPDCEVPYPDLSKFEIYSNG